ncbi:Paraquat-inducible protein A [Salmonella enterica subsp. enterica]|uniref:Paraquat-inducible protein A n=1 Tax=Salmonella enterica I TaxID=59201 RepID=A0A447N932_SALET|nr:Paraquat-inducible protein A [Salmonella enterica subsp. enterica]
MLLLMPFAWSEPLLHIYLLGVRIDANVMHGIWQMTQQGDPLTAAMVLFCVVGAPLILVFSIAYLWFWQPPRHESASSPADVGKTERVG